jgi:integrase/recombinase XerD
MTDERISPLRRRMIEDMSLRHFAEKTQKDYIRAVKTLTIFLGRSPDTATAEDLRLFRLHLTGSRVRPPSIKSTVTALRFFFTRTLDRADAIKYLTFIAEQRKIPVVLSPEEVARFPEAAPGVKYKAAFSVAYGAGLRVSEVASLKVHDANVSNGGCRSSTGSPGWVVDIAARPKSGAPERAVGGTPRASTSTYQKPYMSANLSRPFRAAPIRSRILLFGPLRSPSFRLDPQYQRRRGGRQRSRRGWPSPCVACEGSDRSAFPPGGG